VDAESQLPKPVRDQLGAFLISHPGRVLAFDPDQVGGKVYQVSPGPVDLLPQGRGQ
jgi:hypothetical protein